MVLASWSSRAGWLVCLVFLISWAACQRHVPGPRNTVAPPHSEDAHWLPPFDPQRSAEPVPSTTRGEIPQAEIVPPKLVDAGPRGETSVSPEIQFVFDAPVRAMGEKMDVDPKRLGLTFEPTLPGRLRWESPTRLVFQPAHELPLATSWHVRAEGTVTSEWGMEIPVAAEFDFHTPRPTVHVEVPDVSWDDASEVSRAHWKARVLLRAEAGIHMSELERNVRVTAQLRNGKVVDVPVRVRYADRAEQLAWHAAGELVRVVEPRETWPLGSTVVVEVRGDLPTTGTITMGTPVRESFAVEPGLIVEEVECGGGRFDDGCGIGPIVLHFSNPVPRSQLRHLRVSRPMRSFAVHPGEESEYDGPAGFDSAILWGDFKRGDVLTFAADEMSDGYGQPLAQRFAHTVKFVDPPLELTLRPDRGTLPPDRPHLGVDARFLETVFVSVAPLDASTFAKLQRKAGDPASVPRPDERVRQEIALHPERAFGWSSHAIDLREFVGSQRGPVWVEVAPGRVSARGRGRPLPPAVRGVYQVSELSLSGLTSLPRSVAHVTRLSDRAPVSDATVVRWTTRGARPLARTDAQGRVELGSVRDWPTDTVLEVVTQKDRLVVDARDHGKASVSSDGTLDAAERVLASLTTDRGAYRPGEEVHVTGWSAIATPYEDLGLRTTPAKTPVTLVLRDRAGKEVAKKKVVATPEGKFWGTMRVPADGALGSYEVEASLLGFETRADIVVEDFRSPEFEVRATTSTAHIHPGDPIQVDVSASYYFGETVPIQWVTAGVACRPSYVRPTGFDASWLFGWGRSGREDAASGSASVSKTDPGRGHVELTMVPRFTQRDRPYHCNISVAVVDASNQSMGANTRVLVDPEFYLLMKDIEWGTAPYDASIVVRTVRADGTDVPVEDIVAEVTRTYTAEQTHLVQGKPVFDGWVRREETLPPCRIATSEASPEPRCELPALPHGSYSVTLSARRSGRPYVAWIDDTFEVSKPSKSTRSSSFSPNQPAQHVLDLEVPRRKLSVGDRIVARISASFDGPGELVLAAGGVRKTFPFVLRHRTARVPLQVDDAWVPNAVLIAMAQAPASPRQLARTLWREREVYVPPSHRRLGVEVHMPTEARPRDDLPIEVRVADHKGKPVEAHVALWAVDEAVRSLYAVPDPRLEHVFAPERPADVRRIDSLASLVLPFSRKADSYLPMEWTEDGWLEALSRGTIGLGSVGFGGGGGRAGGLGRRGLGRRQGTERETERSTFDVTPLYLGDLRTDARGVARVRGKLPDNLTTFRVTAIASAGAGDGLRTGRFGVGTGRVRVSRPLIVRPVLPRRLRPGDVADLRVLVQNPDGPAGTVDVTLEAVTEADALELLSPAKLSVAIDRGGQAEGQVRVRAHRAATPQLRLTARHRGTRQADVVRVPLPIAHEPTVLERVAHYGELDHERLAALPLKLPPAGTMDPAHGGLSVAMTSTLLGGLEDAARYLIDYPHGCSEQTSSRLMPLVALGELAKTYPLGIDDPKAFVAAGLAHLQSMQVEDGGFSYWPGDTRSEPYPSAYATWVLVRARQSGIEVSKAMLSRALTHLSHQLESWLAAPAPSIDEDIVMTIGLQALAEAQQFARVDVFDGVWARRDRLPVFARALLLMAMHTANPADARSPVLLADLLAYVDERNDSARIETSGSPWWNYFDSDGRSSALVLSALLQVDPEHRLIAKLARGLMQSRHAGRWANTQENAYALLALADYARLRERHQPHFEAAVWLGEDRLVHRTFAGRSKDEARSRVPMSALQDAGAADPRSQVLLLEKRGPGRLYYRVGLDWAPQGPIEARAEGMSLRRTLRRASGEVVGATTGLGELLTLDLEVTTTSDLTFVALQMPLPAGLEGVHRELGAGTGAFRHSGQRGPWVTHEELRADRVMIYADALPRGQHRTSILVRATTPGNFHWPAAVGEMMYYPEVYGRTEASTLEVRP